jgi:hypothetical protein
MVARRKVRTAALGGLANATNDLNRRQRPSRLYAPHLIAIVAKLVSIAVAIEQTGGANGRGLPDQRQTHRGTNDGAQRYVWSAAGPQ